LLSLSQNLSLAIFVSLYNGYGYGYRGELNHPLQKISIERKEKEKGLGWM
jgi:hypothetical protein